MNKSVGRGEGRMKNLRASKIFRKEIAVFLITAAALAAWLLLCGEGSPAHISHDGQLYLSIADNVVANGHFIQTARPYEVGFVVPFGIPLLLTLLRLLGMSDGAIILFQCAMICMTAVLLFRVETNYFGKGGFAPLLYMLAMVRVQIRPDNVSVEYYYAFWLALLLFVYSEKQMKIGKRLFWMNFAAFWAFVSRPVLSPVYIAVLLYSIGCFLKKQIKLRKLAFLLLVPAILLTCSAAVNYRETGHWVWLENYSGESICLANNPETGTEAYTSKQYDSFMDDRMREIRSDETLDTSEKSVLYKEHAMEYITEHFGQFLRNTAVKGYKMFCSYWKYISILALLGALGILLQYPQRRTETAVILILMGIEVVITSMGLRIGRYSFIIWISGSVHLAAVGHCGLWWLRSLKKKKENV